MSSETTTDETPQLTEETQQDSSPPQPPPASADSLTEKLGKMNISPTSFSIWPPTDRTRDAVTNRLIETLSTPSVLSNRYGTMPPDEAAATAKSIEMAAFDAASSAAGESAGDNKSVDEGIEILQVYSKEISKRVLDTVKLRTTTAAAASGGDKNGSEDTGVVTAASKEVSSAAADNESSSAN